MEVLAGADDSFTGRNAVDWAARRAASLGLRLNIVRVVPGPWVYRSASGYREAMAHANDLLQAEASRVSALVPNLKLRTTRRTGETPVVLRLLSDTAETVVVGSDRSADSHGERFGAVSFEITVVSRCPVAVIPIAVPEVGSGVVVGVDGSKDSMVAVDFAGSEASRMGEDLTLLHVQAGKDHTVSTKGIRQAGQKTTQEGQMLLAAAVRVVRDRCPNLSLHEVLDSHDQPAGALIRAAAQARLLVIGCRGGGSSGHPVGVVAANVLQHLPCPTIVTRPARSGGT